MAPDRISVTILSALGALSFGIAERKIKYILFGIALIAFELESIHNYGPNLSGFVQFDLLSARLFYMVVVAAITFIVIASCKINSARQMKKA